MAKFLKAHPIAANDLIGCVGLINQMMGLGIRPQLAAIQEFQKAQLHLVRPHFTHVVYGFREALQSFPRQPGDQIHMQVDIAQRPEGQRGLAHLFKAGRTADGVEHLLAAGLHADFKLKKPPGRLGQNFQASLFNQVSADFKMIGGPNPCGPRVVDESLPNDPGSPNVKIERPIHQLDNPGPMPGQKGQPANGFLGIQRPHPALGGGQAVLALIGASPGGLDVQKPVLQPRYAVLIHIRPFFGWQRRQLGIADRFFSVSPA